MHKDKQHNLKEAKGWIAEIEDAKNARQTFDMRYRGAKQDYEADFVNEATESKYTGEYPIHWSNVRTVRPHLYFRRPPCRVVRENKQRTNPDHILASEILEKNIEKTLDDQPFDRRMRTVLTHALNSGLGQVWLRYDYKEDDVGNYKDVGSEVAEIVIVHPDDFLMSRARHLDEVAWMARALYFTRDELLERFKSLTSEDLKKFTFGSTSKNDNHREIDSLSNFARTCVWEIWSKPQEEQLFVADGFEDKILERRNPQLPKEGKKILFKEFFPCPSPLLLGSEALDNVYPICDHHYINPQSTILNDIQAKEKDVIRRGIKVAGVYDKQAAKEVVAMLNTQNGDYAPADFDDSAIAAGWEGIVKMFPTEQYAAVLQILSANAAVQRERVFEISGMSDILRGQGDPRATATQEQIKQDSASMRLNEMRLAVAEFVNEIYEMAGEVVAECFSWQTLLKNAGLDTQGLVDGKNLEPQVDVAFVQAIQDPQQQQGTIEYLNRLVRAIKLVRDERQRYFAINVESEAMLKQDEQREKNEAIEFATALTNVVQQFTQAAQTLPTLMPLLPELVMFLVRKYDKGKQFEQSIEQALEQFVQQATQPPPPPQPDPMIELHQQQLQLQAQKQQSDAQIDQLKIELENAFKGRDAAREDFLAQLKAQELQLKAQEQGTKIQIEGTKILQTGEKNRAEQELQGASILQKQQAQEHQEYKDQVELETTGVMR